MLTPGIKGICEWTLEGFINPFKYVGNFVLMCINTVKEVHSFQQVFKGKCYLNRLETTAVETKLAYPFSHPLKEKGCWIKSLPHFPERF